ncbi:MAG: ABC transporter ATP-binding protein, partial [Janthinobacterium sp.]
MADDTDIACGSGKEGQFNLHGDAPVVEITNLWTKFGRTVVHQDLNLEIERGEI